MIAQETIDEMVTLARQARTHAYAPYSHHPVGAVVLAASGRTYTGANVEIAVNGLSVCAERAAVYAAVSAGEREITAVAVSTPKGAAPCGACRQVLAEFAPAGAEHEMVVIMVGPRRNQIVHLSDLLPYPFLPLDVHRVQEGHAAR